MKVDFVELGFLNELVFYRAARDFESRCDDGRPFEVFSDVIVDRDGRCQKTLRHRRIDGASGPSQ